MEKRMVDAMAKLPSKPLRSITILLVDDDPTCLSIVAALLKSWKYEVVTVKHAADALCALRLKNGYFDLVVTDIHMPGMNGFQLHQIIKEEFNLPVVFMSADDKDSVIFEGLTSGAAYFIVKPVTPADLKNLWQYVVAKKAGKGNVDVLDQETASKGRRHLVLLPSSQSDVVNIGSSSTAAKRRCSSKAPAAAVTREKKGDSASAAPKKVKVVWSNGLHNQFLQAIRTLGLDRAVPKKILEFMNVPGLTRENIASHLQKYRIFLKRVTEAGCRIQSSAERRLSQTSSSSESMFTNHGQPLQSQIPALDSPDPIESSSISHSVVGQSRLLSNYGKSRPLLLPSTSNNRHQPDNVSTLVMDNRKGKGRLIDGSISTNTTTTTLVKGGSHSPSEKVHTNFATNGYSNDNNIRPVPSYAGFCLGNDGGLVGFGNSSYSSNNVNAGSSRMISKDNSGFTLDQVANSTWLRSRRSHENPNITATLVPTNNMLPPNQNNTMHNNHHRGNDGCDFGLINNSNIYINDFNSVFLTQATNLQVQPPTMLGERVEPTNVPLSTYDFGGTSKHHCVEEVTNMNWDHLENGYPSQEDEEFLRSVLGYGDNGGGDDNMNYNFGSHSNHR